jgi:hypothetical protein
MASFGRSPQDAVVVSGRVFRALIDLSVEVPGLDQSLVEWFGQVRIAKGISTNLLDWDFRRQVVSALRYGVGRALQGETSDVEDGQVGVSESGE